MNMLRTLVLLIVLVLTSGPLAGAQQPPASETIGGVLQRQKQFQEHEKLEKRIMKERPSSEKMTEKEIGAPGEGEKVLIKKIVVEGATLLTDQKIKEITGPYENQEISLKEMQKIADLITDEYRRKGYVTSRAYLPPQTIKDGILTIRIVEGKLGDVSFKGNRYFSTAQLKKKIALKPQGYFDYAALQRSLIYINENPDRVAKALLLPGKEPGTTDLIVEVEDNLPLHVGFQADNYGSRYIGHNRYGVILEHNNISGHDDKLYFKHLMSEGGHLSLQQVRYSCPLTRRLEVGGYAIQSRLNLGEEFSGLDAKGRAELYGIFSAYRLIENYSLDMRLNLGFDSKNLSNELSGSQLSRDELRIVKIGFDMDEEDAWGRTVLTAEASNGIPDFWGSLSDKDPDASRLGAGGKFTKGTFNLFRLQPMPFSTSFLWKNSFQYSTYTLPAVEQFQLGGATSVRGYPPAERSGDKGFYSALELSFPPYGLSRDIKVPMRKESLYDALRFVLFWDIGMTTFNNAQPGEIKTQTLRSAGFGIRMNLLEDLDTRIEVGYPLGSPTPSDGDHAHIWGEFNILF